MHFYHCSVFCLKHIRSLRQSPPHLNAPRAGSAQACEGVNNACCSGFLSSVILYFLIMKLQSVNASTVVFKDGPHKPDPTGIHLLKTVAVLKTLQIDILGLTKRSRRQNMRPQRTTLPLQPLLFYLKEIKVLDLFISRWIHIGAGKK